MRRFFCSLIAVLAVGSATSPAHDGQCLLQLRAHKTRDQAGPEAPAVAARETDERSHAAEETGAAAAAADAPRDAVETAAPHQPAPDTGARTGRWC
mmetsp:Transcript_11875/g.29798  ORF Transcript_11875/g.29798 Transcript_11875/m.29798 type:complete len:96 (-) Transcript_11875:22-309(-)